MTGAMEARSERVYLPPTAPPEEAARRRLDTLRRQRDAFAAKIAGAETALALVRARIAAGATLSGQQQGNAVDRLHLQTQGLANANRVLAEAEAAFRRLWKEEP